MANCRECLPHCVPVIGYAQMSPQSGFEAPRLRPRPASIVASACVCVSLRSALSERRTEAWLTASSHSSASSHTFKTCQTLREKKKRTRKEEKKRKKNPAISLRRWNITTSSWMNKFALRLVRPGLSLTAASRSRPEQKKRLGKDNAKKKGDSRWQKWGWQPVDCVGLTSISMTWTDPIFPMCR